MWPARRARCSCSTTCSGRARTPSTCSPCWCVPPRSCTRRRGHGVRACCAGLARQYAVGPLAAEDAASLLDNLLGGVAAEDRAVTESVLQRAGGVPFFLISYAQARQQGSAEAVPWDLAQGLRQRVALLPAAGREILGAAAIVGRRVPRALLLAMAGQPEEVVLAGLEAAHRARLLREDDDNAYVFTHDVIREVVEADVGAARRAIFHRRVAEALECNAAGASPEPLAYHYT